ncbi:MAG TPA: hypothetical protein VLT33_16945 [Labilithrix sp.]|nr:hypothetical protein [Labilithrix sp.]
MATVDASTDATVDASDGSISGSPTLFSGGGVAIRDFDVDGTNLFLLFASQKLSKCPLAGCGPGGPSTLMAYTNAVEIEALDGVVHYIFRAIVSGSPTAFAGAVKADGTVVGDREILSPASLTGISNLRTDGSYVYAINTLNPPTSSQVSSLIPFGLGGRQRRFGGSSDQGDQPFDVVGNLDVVWRPGGGTATSPPTMITFERGASAGLDVRYDYPVLAAVPTAVGIDMDVVVALDTAKIVHFCDRTACVAWTSTGTSANAIALDATHLYFGTNTGVLRCEVAEMKTLGTCTPALVMNTGASVAQIVSKNGVVYARTTAPSIVRVLP